MSTIQFGTATAQADIDDRNRATLAVVFKTGLSLSTDTLMFKGFPLALYDAGDGAYALGVCVEPSVPDQTGDDVVTLTWRGTTLCLGVKEGQQYLRISNKSSESKVVDETQMFRGMPLAFNSEKSLILVDAGHSPTGFDEEMDIVWNTNNVTLRRYDSLWYLIVCE